jgi:hypothetical protein
LFSAAKEREKAQKVAHKRQIQESPTSSRSGSPLSTPKKAIKKLGIGSPKYSGASTPIPGETDQRLLDFTALNLNVEDFGEQTAEEQQELPKVTFAREKLLEEVSKTLRADGKSGISLVVVGEWCSTSLSIE